jgi:hypothetical protein
MGTSHRTGTFGLWSVSGGCATTVTSIAAATVAARYGRRVLLVDLGGGAATACGQSVDAARTLDAWLRSSTQDTHTALRSLDALLIDVADGLSVLPSSRAVMGSASSTEAAVAHRWALLVQWIRAAAAADVIVVDAGAIGTSNDGRVDHRREVVASLGRSLLVTRACFATLHAAISDRDAPWWPDGVILLRELGRALNDGDVEDALGVPIAARVDADPAVARACDAGVLAHRVPRQLARSLRHLLEPVPRDAPRRDVLGSDLR